VKHLDRYILSQFLKNVVILILGFVSLYILIDFFEKIDNFMDKGKPMGLAMKYFFLNIPFILWLDNLARGWGLAAYARKRYAHLGRDVKWVPGNNGAAVRQYDLGRIAEKAGLGEVELVQLLEDAHGFLGASGE